MALGQQHLGWRSINLREYRDDISELDMHVCRAPRKEQFTHIRGLPCVGNSPLVALCDTEQISAYWEPTPRAFRYVATRVQ